MNLISVDREKCIKCGVCIEECTTYVLEMGQEGLKEVRPDLCRACGHCVAVCPTQAIDNILSPRVNQAQLADYTRLRPEAAELFLRTRRTVRSYKSSPVSREKILKLVDIARFAHSRGNRQKISYIIIDDKKTIEKATEIAIQWLEDHTGSPEYAIDAYRKKGIDSLLRNAPNLILATAPKDFPEGRENTVICLTYLELFAPTLGVGTCWAGIFEYCALAENSPMLELFKVPEDRVITGAVVAGYPKNRFTGIPERNPLDVTVFMP